MTALAASLFIPWATGIVLVLFDGRRRLVGWLAVAALAANLAALVVLAATVATGDWPAGVGITLRADALGVLFALLSVLALLRPRAGRTRRRGVAGTAARGHPRRRAGPAGGRRMTRILLHAAALLGVYLLVLTSWAPGDVLVGGLLGLAIAVAVRPRRRAPRSLRTPVRMGAAAVVALQTAVEMVRGSWRVVRFCLGAPTRPGFVEIPRGDRSRRGVAMWGVLTGEAPDEVVVDVDETRDVLIVHLVAADDPDAVRTRHRRAHERWQRKVVP